MKIDEAIQSLQADLLRPGSVDKLDFQDAEQLGIEALKAIKKYRQLGVIGWKGDGSVNRKIPRGHLPLLPGETE